MSTTAQFQIILPSGSDATSAETVSTSVTSDNISSSLQSTFEGSSVPAFASISATVAPIVITEELQQPQITKLNVTPDAPHNITPIMIGAYKSIIYKINGTVVQNGFTEPSRPYIISATIVLEDDSTIQAGEFTIPVFFRDYQVNPLVDTLLDQYQANDTYKTQFLENRILPPSFYFTNVIINPDFGGSSPDLDNRSDTQVGWWLHKDTLLNNNIDYTADFSILLDIHVLRSTSYQMQPKEMFGFDFNPTANMPGYSTGNQSYFYHTHPQPSTIGFYAEGPQFRLDDTGMNLNPNGGTAHSPTIVTQNNAGVPLTGIRWSNHPGTYETTSDSKTFVWPFWGGLLNTSHDAFLSGSNYAVKNGYAATKYYCVVQVKQEEKIIVKFYTHPDGLGTHSAGNHSVADAEFFHCEFQYPEKFSRDYVAGFVSTSSLHYNKIVVTNRDSDLLNVLRNTGTNDTYIYPPP